VEFKVADHILVNDARGPFVSVCLTSVDKKSSLKKLTLMQTCMEHCLNVADWSKFVMESVKSEYP